MDKQLHCELVSWSQFQRLCRDLAFEIKKSSFEPDMIVAIGRGGLIPARILSDFLDINDLTSFKIEHYLSTEKSKDAIVRYPLSADINNKNILLVDDVSDSGDTYIAALKHLAEIGRAKEVKTVALHYKTVSYYKPDFYIKTIVKWRWLIYPWAVYEDVTDFIQKMSPKPKTVEEAKQYLYDNYKLKISSRLLTDIMNLMEC